MRQIVIWILLFAPALARAQQAVCARSSLVTLYEEPSQQSRMTWKVAKYMPFIRLEKKGDWIRLTDLEGSSHWGRARDFRTDIRCVVVRVKTAKLRVEPKATGALAPMNTLDLYTPLKRLEDNDAWLQVEDEQGSKAWIHEVNVWKPTSILTVRF